MVQWSAWCAHTHGVLGSNLQIDSNFYLPVPYCVSHVSSIDSRRRDVFILLSTTAKYSDPNCEWLWIAGTDNRTSSMALGKLISMDNRDLSCSQKRPRRP